ncbi:hypothetical protein [Pararhizobium gei]|uniref:hypothetical protein n=1 Tax=Pararhizobium gei TaxID=1395951 RepID=UPI0023DBA480|nr:hypothetical protein [Rhizobium gei]
MTRDAGEIAIDGNELLRTLRIGVKMPRMFGPRMTFATWLLTLAGWVSGTNVVVEVDDESEGEKPVRFPPPDWDCRLN